VHLPGYDTTTRQQVDEFLEHEMGTIVPMDVYRFFCDTAYGVENPSATDNPTLCRSSHLQYLKKEISAYAKVTDMYGIFAELYAFNSDLSKWNVAKVTDMGSMFNNAFAFQSDLSKWNVAKVTNLYLMFSDAKAFNSNLSK
jgi:surface protein